MCENIFNSVVGFGKVKNVLKKVNFIKFAYIFGSKAEGRHGPMSDMDIAVWIDEEYNSGLNSIDAKLILLREFEKLKIYDVDIVILNKAPLILKFMAQRGILLFEKEGAKDERIKFEVNTRREFWDFIPRLKIWTEYMIERMKKGTFGTWNGH